MAIDTENKRRSVSNWICRIPPVPDGKISGTDRNAVAGFYYGIASKPILQLVKVFMMRDGGTPKTGLSPTIDIFLKVFDGSTAGSTPTITELAGGYYKFHHYVDQDTVVRVDSQDALMSDSDRYNEVGVITHYDDAIDRKLSDVESNIIDQIDGVADSVWEEDLRDHTTRHTAGKMVQQIRRIANSILALIS